MTSFGLAAIPWRFQDSDITKVWQWRTEHFEVTVTAEPNSFYWELGDWMVPNQGMARFLAEARAQTFAEAERLVREAVGKSYPPALGYGRYAGSLATTFTLATGEVMDLGQFDGQRVVVGVRLPTGAVHSLVGYAKVVHYELHLDSANGGVVKIQPPHVVSIVREGGGAGKTAAQDSYSGVGRIYRGSMTRGCTGRAGFMPDSIDHIGPPCPVHEDTVPLHLRG